MTDPAHPLRQQLEQRLVVGRAHIQVTSLDSATQRSAPAALAMIRSALGRLASGGPWPRWINDEAVAQIVDAPPLVSGRDLCQELCRRIQSRWTHVEVIDDHLERFAARLSLAVKERTGFVLPHMSDSNPAWCRHFAATLSAAYARATEDVDHLANTSVLLIMGIPRPTFGPCRLHAWNWFVDFDAGTIAAFDPQNTIRGVDYANASALLYSLAAARQPGAPIPGVRLLVRRADSLHGGLLLFHLARHPIERSSRWKIAARLRAASFERVVPGWQQELEAWDDVWGEQERAVHVDDVIRFADET